MLKSLLLCACCSLAPGIDRARTEDPLDALVAKTNALEGFSASYRVTDRDGVVMNMTLSYAAPDRACMSVAGDKGPQSVWVVGGELCMDGAHGSGPHDFGRVDVQGLCAEGQRIRDLLRTEFPGAPVDSPDELGAGASFFWEWKDTKSSEKASSNVGPSYSLSRSHLCGWLKNLQRSGEQPSETDEGLVWVLEGDYRVVISKSSGFITRARRLDPDSKSEVLLEKLELEAPLDPAIFTAPKSPPEGARDFSADMERGMRMQTLGDVRVSVWVRLSKWIDAGSVTWDEHSAEKLTRVFRPLSSGMLRCTMEERLKQTQHWIDSASEALASRVSALARDDEDGLARLKAERDHALADMEQKFKTAMADFSDQVEPPAGFSKDFELTAEFLECERATIRAEFQVQVTDAMLALFRERSDAALTR